MRLDVAPAMGGAIIGWRDGDVGLLRGSFARTSAPFSVRDCASFPLIPFSNRVAHGAFPFGGQVYELPKDSRDPRHAMHGNALYAAWEVNSISKESIDLAFAYRAGEGDAPYFPFSYDAGQRYRIGPDFLAIDLRITSRDRRRFPAGLGHHLYFASEPDTILTFKARNFWINDQEGLPLRPETDGLDEFASGHPIGSRQLDTCFSGWHGRASIHHPSRGFRLEMTTTAALRHAVLFTPADQPFFAFEPVSHLSDGIHRMTEGESNGLKILSPGEMLDASIFLRKLTS